MPRTNDLLSSLLSSPVDLEQFALAPTVEARRAFVEARFTPGTADHFLLSVLCDQQAGEPYGKQRAKLDKWVSIMTKAAMSGNSSVNKPVMGPGYEKLDGRARLQAVLANPDGADPKTSPEERAAAVKWLQEQLLMVQLQAGSGRLWNL